MLLQQLGRVSSRMGTLVHVIGVCSMFGYTCKAYCIDKLKYLPESAFTVTSGLVEVAGCRE